MRDEPRHSSINETGEHWYKGGIFAGCGDDEKRSHHAVAVVGYGSEDGVDYWLAKNSWGTSFGENGFFRIQRGRDMCGFGRKHITISCKNSNGK